MVEPFRRKVNYYETDMMGVVHHSNYIRYLEEARCAWIESMGIPMAEIEKRGFTIPVLEVNCKYKRHVTQGDTILIGIKIAEYNGVRMTIDYDVRNAQNGEVVIRQGKYILCVTQIEKNEFPLAAPVTGKMDRIIKESAECVVRYRLMKKEKVIFDKTINNASFEYEYTKEKEFDRLK